MASSRAVVLRAFKSSDQDAPGCINIPGLCLFRFVLSNPYLECSERGWKSVFRPHHPPCAPVYLSRNVNYVNFKQREAGRKGLEWQDKQNQMAGVKHALHGIRQLEGRGREDGGPRRMRSRGEGGAPEASLPCSTGTVGRLRGEKRTWALSGGIHGESRSRRDLGRPGIPGLMFMGGSWGPPCQGGHAGCRALPVGMQQGSGWAGSGPDPVRTWVWEPVLGQVERNRGRDAGKGGRDCPQAGPGGPEKGSGRGMGTVTRLSGTTAGQRVRRHRHLGDTLKATLHVLRPPRSAIALSETERRAISWSCGIRRPRPRPVPRAGCPCSCGNGP